MRIDSMSEEEIRELVDSQKFQDICRLLELTNEVDLGMNNLENQIEQVKKLMPTVKDDFWTQFRDEFSREKVKALFAMVFDEHLSHQEVKDLIDVYETPVMQRYLDKRPAIQSATRGICEELGRRVGHQVEQRLRQQQATED